MRAPCVVLAIAVWFGAVGCKKDDSDLPANMRPKKVSVDPGKIDMPALLESIPADTPYVVASLEPVSRDYYAKMKKAFGPMIEAALRMRSLKNDDDKVLDAVLEELDGKMTGDGLESLGLSSQPRFAVYGQNGLLPVVFRLEVKDDKVLLATIQRIAKRAGQALPDQETRRGHAYWRMHGKRGNGDVVVALADNQLVVAAGPTQDVDGSLDMILGISKPKDNLADGKALTDVMTRHGFGANLVGYLDTHNFLLQILKQQDIVPSSSCKDELERIAEKVPRIAAGYGELTPERASTGMVVELAPDIVDRLQALKTEVPGFARAFADDPLFAMGGGLDLDKAMSVAGAFGDVLESVGEACGVDEVRRAGRKLSRGADRGLPDEARGITGFAAVVTDVEFGGRRRRNPIPDVLEGWAVVAVADAQETYDAIAATDRKLRKLDLSADGKMHRLDIPDRLPFDIFAGIGKRTFVLSAGDKGKSLGDKVIDAHAGGKAPFLAYTADYGRTLELMMDMAPDLDDARDGISKAMYRALAKTFGRTTMTLDVTDKGLAIWAVAEMQ